MGNNPTQTSSPSDERAAQTLQPSVRMEQTVLSFELQQGFILSKSKHFVFLFKMDSASSFCPHSQHRPASVDLHSSQVSLHLAVNSIKLEESTKTGREKGANMRSKCSLNNVLRDTFYLVFKICTFMNHFSVYAKVNKVYCKSKLPV